MPGQAEAGARSPANGAGTGQFSQDIPGRARQGQGQDPGENSTPRQN